jgi:gamma-polyglutamate biosynthesis protein CapA
LNSCEKLEPNLTIAAVGDICLSDHVLCSGFGVSSSIEKHGHHSLFDDVKSYLSDADIVFGNLECVLSDKKNLEGAIKDSLFKGKPEYIEIIKELGFNCLNIANNHTMQHGSEGFENTIKILEANSVFPIGVCGREDYYSKPYTIRRNGHSCSMIGYSFIRDNFSNEPLYAKGNLEHIIDDIKKIKKESDYLVVSCHWGLELMCRPSNNMVMIAHTLIDAGADVILGHHSHTLQGIEKYRNKLIIYSLGNFIFDLMWDLPTRKTGIFRILLGKGNISYEFTPTFINNKCQIQVSKNTGYSMKEFYSRNDQDQELENLDYYLECHKLERMLGLKKVMFLLKNIFRINKRALYLLIKNKILGSN